MIVIVDDRKSVTSVYESWFTQQGAASVGLTALEFDLWIEGLSDLDGESVDAVLIGYCKDKELLPKFIRRKTRAAALALIESSALDIILALFRAGFDDVLRKPMHVREILARVRSIQSRREGQRNDGCLYEMLTDGDHVVDGITLELPRREKYVLEYLVRNKGRRVTKAQLFASVYGMFNDDIDDSIIESHICKLRKKLRERIGYDPIDSKRYLGYMLRLDEPASRHMHP